jgi:hypothetical protein
MIASQPNWRPTPRCAIAILLVLSHLAYPAWAASAPPVALTLTTDQAVYAAGQPLSLHVTFTNRSTEPVTVATDTMVLAFQVHRNGKPIPKEILSTTGLAPQFEATASLTTLNGGAFQSMPLPLALATTTSPPCCLLQWVVDNTHGTAYQVYNLSSPGVYTLKASYMYVGNAKAYPNVYRGKLVSNVISFSVQ